MSEVPIEQAGLDTRGKAVWKRLAASPVTVASLAFLAAVVLVALCADWVSPHDPNTINLRMRLQPPLLFGGDAAYPLGTDQIGKDILSRIIHGSRLSLSIGLAAVALSILVGVSLGICAGYFGGWFDTVVMRAADVQLAFPFILLAITIIGVLGPTVQNIVVVLALSGWVQFARIVRSETLSLRQRPFIEASRIIGSRHSRIIWRNVLPNVMSSIIILATLELGRVIILESGLTFLGLGVPPPAVTWGAMLAEGRDYVREAWWLSVFPGLALMFIVLAINLAGDGLRSILDPSMRIP